MVMLFFILHYAIFHKTFNQENHTQTIDTDSCQQNIWVSFGIIHTMHYSLSQAGLYFEDIKQAKTSFSNSLKKMKDSEIKRVPKFVSVSNTQIKSDK